jgi:hypothetical protein
MAYMSDRPCIVSLENLTEAASVGVNLALVDQSLSSTGIIGPTTGIYPTDPSIEP